MEQTGARIPELPSQTGCSLLEALHVGHERAAHTTLAHLSIDRAALATPGHPSGREGSASH